MLLKDHLVALASLKTNFLFSISPSLYWVVYRNQVHRSRVLDPARTPAKIKATTLMCKGFTSANNTIILIILLHWRLCGNNTRQWTWIMTYHLKSGGPLNWKKLSFLAESSHGLCPRIPYESIASEKRVEEWCDWSAVINHQAASYWHGPQTWRMMATKSGKNAVF